MLEGSDELVEFFSGTETTSNRGDEEVSDSSEKNGQRDSPDCISVIRK